VIVVLGILAAIAIPRYASYVKEARIAALNGLAGAIRSSVAVVQSRYVATGATASPVDMQDGSTVAVGTAGAATGVPTAAAGGIGAAVKVDSTFAYTAGTSTWDFAPAITDCNVVYSAADGTTTINTDGC
jgi:MSHA pilin protein MshA